MGGVWSCFFLPEVFPFSCTLFIVVIFDLDFLIISIYIVEWSFTSLHLEQHVDMVSQHWCKMLTVPYYTDTHHISKLAFVWFAVFDDILQASVWQIPPGRGHGTLWRPPLLCQWRHSTRRWSASISISSQSHAEWVYTCIKHSLNSFNLIPFLVLLTILTILTMQVIWIQPEVFDFDVTVNCCNRCGELNINQPWQTALNCDQFKHHYSCIINIIYDK